MADGPDTLRLAELLAFSHGDLLEPKRCGFCGDTDVEQSLYAGDYDQDRWRCQNCGAITSGELVYRNRVEATARRLGVLDMDAARCVVEEWLP